MLNIAREDLLHSQDKDSVRCAVLVEGSKCAVQSSEHLSFTSFLECLMEVFERSLT